MLWCRGVLIGLDMALDNLDFKDKDLDNLVIDYENKIRKALNKHTPKTECTIVIMHKFPWFTNEKHQQTRIVRRREKIWQKYKQDHQWKALQYECDKYRKLLKRTKADKLSELVTDCRRDAKIYTN